MFDLRFIRALFSRLSLYLRSPFMQIPSLMHNSSHNGSQGIRLPTMDQAGRISEPPNTLITSGTVAKQELPTHFIYFIRDHRPRCWEANNGHYLDSTCCNPANKYTIVGQTGQTDEEAFAMLVHYYWPLNIRTCYRLMNPTNSFCNSFCFRAFSKSSTLRKS